MNRVTQLPKKASVTSRGKDAALPCPPVSGALFCVQFWESHFERDLSKHVFPEKVARVS